MFEITDTIAAIATGNIVSAIGIIRLSGSGAIEIAGSVFTPVSGKRLSECPDRTLVLGTLSSSKGETLDHCLCTISRAPNSYTGENTAEFQCHGSPTVLRLTLEALFSKGARQALAGEFTKRAFLNGRMDLTQAEAVIDLIDSETDEAAKNAAGQLGGAILRKTDAVYDKIIDIISHYHAVLDYPDEEIEVFEIKAYSDALERAERELSALLDTFEHGRVMKNGVVAAIVGSPNAGKSSLLNALLGYDRAIVTNIPGTTRDTLEESVVLGGVRLRLQDTAGLRGTNDPIEKLGVDRARNAAGASELVLAVFDGSEMLSAEDAEAIKIAKTARRSIAVINKSDLPQKIDISAVKHSFETVCTVSALDKTGLDTLDKAVAGLFPVPNAPAGEILTNARHADAVGRALISINESLKAMKSGATPDIILTEAENALGALGELSGKTVREDVTRRIFERFCVGKQSYPQTQLDILFSNILFGSTANIRKFGAYQQRIRRMTMSYKYVYMFSEGNGSMRELLGGKGAGLAEMTRLGLPVPQGFTVTTEACTRYYDDGETISSEIEQQINTAMDELEKITGKRFGDPNAPLLLSVRSGARVSMPGMMDTVLNLGINDSVADSFVRLTGNPRFVFDSYRRFIQMFSDVVIGLPKSTYEHEITKLKEDKKVTFDSELDADDMKYLVKRFKELYAEQTKETFPSDPKVQLLAAVKAVFRSWNTPRAITYRRLNDIPGTWGTAVNVQSMVFGNMGETSGTGVAFSRDPATGENKLYGEFLMNAQGEDVVAGIRTPVSIERLNEVNPDTYKQFTEVAKKLELHYKDMQDMEFTIENGKLYMLQTRNGKRTAQAALQVAVDMVNEGLLTKEEALLKIEPKQLDNLLHVRFDEAVLKATKPVANGLAASPGAACGRIVFTAEKAIEEAKFGPVLLVRNETSPEDIEGMAVVQGILTATGGRTSHAAVVARGMGVCCVAGCSAIHINEEQGYLTIGTGLKVNEGDFISIDGNTGNVYVGSIKTVDAVISGNFATVMSWADASRRLGVRANADTPKDAETALKLGAEGIGLTRTEHMFFKAERIFVVRQMILSDTVEQRQKALDKLLPMQRGDFEGIYRVMGERPVTIRLLDPPLHEFLPKDEEDIKALSTEMGVSYEDLVTTVKSLHEMNPMMGHRGCRLSVTFPEITKMQTRAIIEAAMNVNKELGIKIVPEIMIPLVCDAKELKLVRNIVVTEADEIIKNSGVDMHYEVGTMIETPRAAVVADTIAAHAEFFSFGTNDLTQMTFGFSRDDSGKFVPSYLSNNIFEKDPFERLDSEGVGKLLKNAATEGRRVNPKLSLGICGEHGGDPASIEFVNSVGLNYVSCSPYRVPIARLAAAQAAIKQK